MVSQYIDCTVDSTGITYSGNTAAHGGAVYANEHTTFTSNGDTFESNEASVEGGAVNILSRGEFIMNNGSMKGNTAPKGSGVSTDGIFRMSGSAVINPDEDVYLYPSRYISVLAALTSNKVATVTPSDYTTGRVVVSNSYSEKGSVLEPKFTLTPKAGYFLRGGNKNGANDTDVVISENYPVTYDCGKTPNPTGHFSDGTNLDDEDVKEWGVDYELRTDKPTAKGYLFSGWNTEEDGSGDDYFPGDTYSENEALYLYAQWTPIKYTVAYNGNGSTSGSMLTQTFTYGKSYNLAANGFVRSNYHFAGWNTKADGSGTSYSDKQSVKNLATKNGTKVTLYAQWAKNTYTIRFHANGGAGSMADVTVPYDTVYSLPKNQFTLKGYQFDEWIDADHSMAIDDEGNISRTSAQSRSDVVDLYAQWTPNEYYVAYNSNKPNGATGNISGTMAKSNHEYDTSNNLKANGYRLTGWTFQNWNTKADGSGTSYIDKQSVTNLTATNGATVTLYAQWKANTYTVKYDGNGSTGGSTASSSHTYDTAKALTANGFTKTGYTFKGWNTKADGSGTSYADKASVKNLSSTNWATVTLYAQWTANKYTVTYNANGGSGTMAADTATYGSGYVTKENAFTRTGYTFKGWNEKADGTGTDWTSWIGKSWTWTYTKNITLYAQWTVNKYTLTITGDSGVETITGNGTYNYGTTANVTYQIKPGYHIKNITGTTADGDPNGAWTGHTGKSGTVTDTWTVKACNRTIVVHTEPNTYTVKYDGNGNTGGSTGSSNHTYGTAKALTANEYTKTGYSFNGWNTKADGSGTAYADKASVKNLTTTNGGTVTLYAQWTKNSYYLDLNGWLDGKSTGNITGYGTADIYVDGVQKANDVTDFYQKIPYGSRYEIKDIKVVTGHTYVGVHSGSITGTIGASNVGVVLEFKTNKYTVTFDKNNGTGTMADQTFTYGVKQALAKNAFTRTGYTFAGWNTQADGKGTTYTDQQEVTSLSATDGATIRLYAQWTANKYTVAYNANGGTGTMANQELTYDKSATLNANTFKRTGYRFNGWNTKADGTGTSYADKASVKNLTANSGGTVTLYAKWYSAAPELETKDATYYEGQDITKAMLLKNVTKASDVEDGDMAGKVIITKIEYSAGKLVDGKPQAAYTKSWTNGMPDSEKLDTWFQQLPKEKAPVTHKITYQVTDLSGKTTTKTSTITVKYNEFPVIKAEDRYFTLEEAKSGKITKDVLLKEAIASGKLKAEDKEDGVISNKVTILDYKDTDFKNVNGNATVTVIFKVNDSMGPNGVGKETVCEVKVKIIDSGSDYWRDDDGTARKQVRFITQKYYDKNKDTDFHGMTSEEIEASSNNGGLNVMSKWYQNAAYKALLTGSFAKDAGTDYKISAEKAKELKQKIESNGIGNSKSSNALTDIYNSLK